MTELYRVIGILPSGTASWGTKGFPYYEAISYARLNQSTHPPNSFFGVLEESRLKQVLDEIGMPHEATEENPLLDHMTNDERVVNLFRPAVGEFRS